jgi:hypothetical protein
VDLAPCSPRASEAESGVGSARRVRARSASSGPSSGQVDPESLTVRLIRPGLSHELRGTAASSVRGRGAGWNHRSGCFDSRFALAVSARSPSAVAATAGTCTAAAGAPGKRARRASGTRGGGIARAPRVAWITAIGSASGAVAGAVARAWGITLPRPGCFVSASRGQAAHSARLRRTRPRWRSWRHPMVGRLPPWSSASRRFPSAAPCAAISAAGGVRVPHCVVLVRVHRRHEALERPGRS